MKHIIKSILAVLNSRERKQLAFLVLLNLLMSIADIISLALLLFIINFYTATGSAHIISFLPEWLSQKESLSLIFLFLLFFIVKSIAGYSISKKQNRFVYRVALRISEARLLDYFEGTYSNYVKVDSAAHIRNISQQPIEFCHYVLAGMQQIITEIILILLTVITILFFNAKLFLLLFLILLPAVFLLAYISRKRLKSVRTHVKTSGEKALQYLKEALSGYIETAIYDKQDFFIKRYSGYQQQLNEYLSDLQITQGISSRLIEVFAVFGLFVLIAINKISGNTQMADLMTIGAFMAAAYKIIPGIVKVLNSSAQIKAYEFTIHDLLPENKVRSQNDQSAQAISSIQFKGISFAQDKLKVLDNFNMEMKQGEFIGISGLSGKGKTTIINLLLGFLSPDAGTIYVNGLAADSLQLELYRKQVAYVKQQPFLIHDSILKNITLSENGHDQDRLQDVINTAGMNEWLHTFPDGMAQLVTENGKNISGGQRQRIAIARALYKPADLVILDEPFNELDEKSEISLLHYLKKMSEKGKMVILITHNKNSLSFCQKVINMHEA